MTKSLLLCAVFALACTASASSNFLSLYEVTDIQEEMPVHMVGANSTNSTNMTSDQIYVNYITACSRGAIQGFQQGFYANNSFILSTQCLNNKTQTQMLKLYQNYMSGAILNLFQTFSTVYQLNFMMVNTCRTEKVFYDLTTFCLTNDCSLTKIIGSFTSKFF